VRAWRLDRSFQYSVPGELADDIEVGSLVRISLGKRKVRGVVLEVFEGSDEGLEPVRGLVLPTPVAPAPLRDLLTWVATRYVAPLPAAFERVVPPRVRVKPQFAAQLAPGPPPQTLLAYRGGRGLLDAVAGGAAGVWSLRSLPGADRGRLISELVGAAARATGAAIVIVPEVHYGSEVLDGLQAAFPGCLRLDSAQSDAQRSAGWLGMAAGNGLGIGGRGAVLVPCSQLRLLVVDEEHHRTYKEDRAPRFDARRVAIERARRDNAICVLVSVAPLLETGAAVLEGGFQLAEPARAADRATRPIIELMEKPQDRQLAPGLHRRIHDCLASGGKAGLLVPTRGFARSLWCGTCRRSVRCPVCEAGVRLEAGGTTIRCPRCGSGAPTPERCPTCGAQDFHMVGAGSERLADQLGAMFPRATVSRVDADTLRDAGPASDADLYVTTWIGTKPTLRPEVSLVAVLDADALIRMPDFRAAENAYRALVEMSEWAGPAESGGRLLIQTAAPSHHSIQAVARADYGFFLERELQQRRELAYPPFAELVKVRASGAGYPELLDEVARGCHALGARVLGPIEVRGGPGGEGGSAAEVLVKHRDAERVSEYLRGILPKVPAGTRLRVDVDPR
jgi:primosomal protein N' (replication factor Y) (superfamily II helicase)